MKIVQKFEAEDGALFDIDEACIAYESRLPFVRLLGEVESAVKADAAFAAKIEALGFRLRRDRYDRGEKRTRAAKADPARQITGPAASADRREGATLETADVS